MRKQAARVRVRTNETERRRTGSVEVGGGEAKLRAQDHCAVERVEGSQRPLILPQGRRRVYLRWSGAI